MKKTVLILTLILIITSVFAKELTCPPADQLEISRFVINGTVSEVNFVETLAGRDYYNAKISLEDIRMGKLLELDSLQRVDARLDLPKFKEQGFVNVKFSDIALQFENPDAQYIKGEQVKVYLRSDTYSKELRTQLGECGKVLIKKAPLWNRITAFFKRLF